MNKKIINKLIEDGFRKLEKQTSQGYTKLKIEDIFGSQLWIHIPLDTEYNHLELTVYTAIIPDKPISIKELNKINALSKLFRVYQDNSVIFFKGDHLCEDTDSGYLLLIKYIKRFTQEVETFSQIREMPRYIDESLVSNKNPIMDEKEGWFQ